MKKENITIEDLVRMVQKGFEEIAKKHEVRKDLTGSMKDLTYWKSAWKE